MFTIMFEKDGNVTFHTSYSDKYITKAEQGYSLSESLRCTINDDMYKMNGTTVSECSLCTIFIEKEKFYCNKENLDNDRLIFTKKG